MALRGKLFSRHHDQLQIANTTFERAILIAFIHNKARSIAVRTLDPQIKLVRQNNADMTQGTMGGFVQLLHQIGINPAPRQDRTQIIDNALAHILRIDHERDRRFGLKPVRGSGRRLRLRLGLLCKGLLLV